MSVNRGMGMDHFRINLSLDLTLERKCFIVGTVLGIHSLQLLELNT